MGGRDKAALPAPDGSGSLLQRQVALGRELGFEVVLLGARPQSPDADPAPDPGLPRLPDEPPGVGPLGALGPLLRRAGQRPAILLACDMPHVGAALLSRLSTLQTDADVVAPRAPGSDKWLPTCARYHAAPVLPLLQAALADGERSFQGLLRRLHVQPLALDADEQAQLCDWDTPTDIARDPGP